MKISLVSTSDKLTDITSTNSACLMFITVVGKFHLKVIKNKLLFPPKRFTLNSTTTSRLKTNLFPRNGDTSLNPRTILLEPNPRTTLVVQWLRLCAPNAGDLSSIPGQGTRSHMPQLKIPCATIKTWCSQINK